MGKKRSQYNKDYKVEAVCLIVEEGRPIFWSGWWAWRSLDSIVYRWRNKSKEGNIDPFPGKGRLSLEYEDLRQLSIENKRLSMERDMFKKVVAFFSEEQ